MTAPLDFTIWRRRLLDSAQTVPIELCVPQEDIINILGPPDDCSVTKKGG